MKREKAENSRQNNVIANTDKVALNTLEHQLTFFNRSTTLNNSSLQSPFDKSTLPEFHSFYEYEQNISNANSEISAIVYNDSTVENESLINKNALNQININKETQVDEKIQVDGETQVNGKTCVNEEIQVNEESPVPKLIRSNSYIIETPSPLLLAYMKKQQELNSSNEDSEENKKQTNENKDYAKAVDPESSTPLSTRNSDQTAAAMREVIENNFTSNQRKTLKTLILN